MKYSKETLIEVAALAGHVGQVYVLGTGEIFITPYDVCRFLNVNSVPKSVRVMKPEEARALLKESSEQGQEKPAAKRTAAKADAKIVTKSEADTGTTKN
jgi:hypothetical protein